MVKEYIERESAMPANFCIGVRCQECPFYDTPINGGCKIAEFIVSIPSADVVERPQWIPVTERLPDGEAWDRVLVYTDEGNIQTAPKCKVGNGWITHWMPLPEPPKEEA